jgi:hypothetical protein
VAASVGLEQAKEKEAYRVLRDWVLTRQAPPDQALDLPKLVEALQIDPENLSWALVKLADPGTVGPADPVAVVGEARDPDELLYRKIEDSWSARSGRAGYVTSGLGDTSGSSSTLTAIP